MQLAFGAFSIRVQRDPGGDLMCLTKKMFMADPQFEVKAQKCLLVTSFPSAKRYIATCWA